MYYLRDRFDEFVEQYEITPACTEEFVLEMARDYKLDNPLPEWQTEDDFDYMVDHWWYFVTNF